MYHPGRVTDSVHDLWALLDNHGLSRIMPLPLWMMPVSLRCRHGRCRHRPEPTTDRPGFLETTSRTFQDRPGPFRTTLDLSRTTPDHPEPSRQRYGRVTDLATDRIWDSPWRSGSSVWPQLYQPSCRNQLLRPPRCCLSCRGLVYPHLSQRPSDCSEGNVKFDPSVHSMLQAGNRNENVLPCIQFCACFYSSPDDLPRGVHQHVKGIHPSKVIPLLCPVVQPALSRGLDHPAEYCPMGVSSASTFLSYPHDTCGCIWVEVVEAVLPLYAWRREQLHPLMFFFFWRAYLFYQPSLKGFQSMLCVQCVLVQTDSTLLVVLLNKAAGARPWSLSPLIWEI